MEPKDFAAEIGRLAALEEPARRRLYLHVAGQDGDVSRDDAARAVGISRALAAFHLDKLVDAGLLETTFRRLSARVGPGAGRPSKLYRRAATQLDVSLPPRRYELAAHVLAEALAENAADGRKALRHAAREHGKRLARQAPSRSRRGDALGRAARALEGYGFAPRRTAAGEIELRNCPFDSLRRCPEVVCNMNLALVQGLLSGLEIETVEPRLDPQPERCCVVLKKSAGGA